MAQNVNQIRIGKHDVGIIGLIDAIEAVAREHSDAENDRIAEAIFIRLSKENYIPSHVKDDYKKAFLREYQKHLGQAVTVTENLKDELVISVIGAGCSRCDKLEADVITVLSELKIAAQVDHIRDLKEIAKLGIMGTPALQINGKTMCTGIVPAKSQLIKWLNPFQKS